MVPKLLNTEDTEMSKSLSCAQQLTIYFGGRNRPFIIAPLKLQFQQKIGFGMATSTQAF